MYRAEAFNDLNSSSTHISIWTWLTNFASTVAKYPQSDQMKVFV